jgi:DNA-directed RNA polymerase subunit RPC12/RpoP
MEDEDTFCPSCGARVSDKEGTAISPSVSSSDPSSPKKGKHSVKHPGLFALLCMVIVISVTGGIYYLISRNNQNTAFNNGDTKGDAGLVVKKKPTISVSEEELGIEIQFDLHANDDYDYVSAQYSLLDSSNKVLDSEEIYWTVLKAGYDYYKTVSLSDYLFQCTSCSYKITDYR